MVHGAGIFLFGFRERLSAERRLEQSRYWMYEALREGIYMQVFKDPAMKKELEAHEKAISEGQITSFMAASSILNKFKSGN